jgi:hypothetical protein
MANYCRAVTKSPRGTALHKKRKKIIPENFSPLSPVSLTQLNKSIRDYLREFSKKIETIPMAYSGARGTLIYEKNLKSKISCKTPFKAT